MKANERSAKRRKPTVIRNEIGGLDLLRYALIGIALSLITAIPTARADDTDPLAEARTDKGLISLTKAAPGITPVSDYTGDIYERGAALGDLFGARQNLYERGITLDADVTQVVQGIADGGPDEKPDARYSGLADYGMTLDTAKLGFWSGGLVTVNAQTSWGNSLLGDTGGISPVNFLSLYPDLGDNKTVLMEYYYTQAFPGGITAIAGRLNGVNFLDRNRFANDPHNQFLNTSMGNNPLFGEFLSFSTYAALVSVPVNKHFNAAVAVWDPNDQPGDYGGTSGFFDEVGIGTELDFSWTLSDHLDGAFRPVLGFSTADTLDFSNPRLEFDLITGQPLPDKPDNYILHANFEQYFWKPEAGGAAKTQARMADYDFQERGAGIFLRGSWLPEDRNVYDVFFSGGVGARGVFDSRPYDRFGAGFYWLKESDDFDDSPFNEVENEVGVEAYYNLAITPWATLTGDIQWIDSGLSSVDNAVILGSRLQVRF
jgi:porin